eukprot:3348391-Pyramimonas_sp.AAC.3
MGFFPTVHLQCRWLVSSPPPAGCWLQQSLRNNRLASREGVRADGWPAAKGYVRMVSITTWLQSLRNRLASREGVRADASARSPSSVTLQQPRRSSEVSAGREERVDRPSSVTKHQDVSCVIGQEASQWARKHRDLDAVSGMLMQAVATEYATVPRIVRACALAHLLNKKGFGPKSTDALLLRHGCFVAHCHRPHRLPGVVALVVGLLASSDFFAGAQAGERCQFGDGVKPVVRHRAAVLNVQRSQRREGQQQPPQPLVRHGVPDLTVPAPSQGPDLKPSE